MKLCALPVRTVMFKPICAYCGKTGAYYAYCDYQKAVLACADPEHQALADRDAKAWLGIYRCVRPEHYREDPLFQKTELLSSDIVVKRSSGEIEIDGWTIRKPSLYESALVRFRKEDEAWVILVIKNEEDIQKDIPVRELKLSLPEEQHGLVDAFEARLVAGFYHAEIQAYEKALKAQEEM